MGRWSWDCWRHSSGSLYGALRSGDIPRSGKAARDKIAEAPAALLVPQYLLILGILVMSFFPKLLIVPISEAMDPYFASTLVWAGMSLEMIYGYWNPVPTMVIAIVVSATLFVAFWLFKRGSLKLRAAPHAGRQRHDAPRFL